MGSNNLAGQLNLPPGFRFHPSDEELVVHYLCKKSAGHTFALRIIAEVDIYKFDPWNLPDKALFGEKEWFFFSPRDRKYPNGSRPNRAAGSGYWKATGSDKPILSSGNKVGVKKALVFYIGKAPKGTKTNWIMHEYRLADGSSRAAKKKGSLRLDDWVLCRIYKKSFGGGPNRKPTTTTTIQTTTTTAEMARQRSDQPFPSGFEDIILASLPDMDQRQIINNNSMMRTQLPSPNPTITNRSSMLSPGAPLLNFHHHQNEPLYSISEHDEFTRSCTSTSRFAEDIHSTFSKIRPRQHESILQDQIGGGLGFLNLSNNLPTTFSQMNSTAPSTLRTSSPFANGLGLPSYVHRP